MQANNKFWQFEIAHWFEILNSSVKGLSQDTAEKILAGKAIKKKDKSELEKDIRLFISQYKSPLMLLLIGAVIISAFLGDASDVIIILSILFSTGMLSFYQERNAGRIVEKLQSLIPKKSTVFRDGKEREIFSNQVVPGDVIVLKAGDIIPADCLIIESNDLIANESSLTGESFPIQKDQGVLDESTPLSKRSNCLWEGTNIISGGANALVIETGKNTIFGSITLRSSGTFETTFEKGIKRFGYFLMKITLILTIFVLIVNLVNQKSIIDSALFALALAIGMSPELLPAIMTIAMSAGARRLLNKKVIVKKLNSIQNLGEINLLCTDKTGTITEGVTAISGITNGLGEESYFVKQLAYWNAFFETGYTNPIDMAIKQLNLSTDSFVQKLGEIPYDFTRKRLSIAITLGTESLLISKGAFTQVLGTCTTIRLGEDNYEDIQLHLQALNYTFAQFGSNGIRAIAVAYKNINTNKITNDLENEMIFAGFVLINDPIKAGIRATIDELNLLQVDLKIITGDNKIVAQTIGSRLGIQNPIVMTGKEVAQTNADALKLLASKTHIFAEVEPHQKEQIILALKHSYTVGYMGDGINDVTAINAADVGISVENAVDVTREAADFILMEKDLMVLTEGIREGRKTFANSMKYLYINTGATFGNMCSVAAASLMLPFLPMLPKQILLTNFLTDLPFLAVTSDNVDQQLLDKPGKWNLKLIRYYMIIFGVHSSIFDLITFLILYAYMKVQEAEFQSGWFVESGMTQLLIVFIIRTQMPFFKSKPGKWLTILSALALVFTLCLPYFPFALNLGMVPLPLPVLAAMILIVLGYVITADFLKYWFFKKFSNI